MSERWAAPEPHKPHMVSRPQDCNLPKPCKLTYSQIREAEVVHTNVERLMNMTKPFTRSEITELITAVFLSGVTSVVHERG
jgi:hypothetical protein